MNKIVFGALVLFACATSHAEAQKCSPVEHWDAARQSCAPTAVKYRIDLYTSEKKVGSYTLNATYENPAVASNLEQKAFVAKCIRGEPGEDLRVETGWVTFGTRIVLGPRFSETNSGMLTDFEVDVTNLGGIEKNDNGGCAVERPKVSSMLHGSGAMRIGKSPVVLIESNENKVVAVIEND